MLPILPLVVGLTLAAPVQEPATAPASTERTAPGRSPTTVLRLQNGAVLRARARAVEDGWEVLSRGEWVFVPATQVASAKVERELLEQAERLARKLPRKDPVKHVAYADWLVGEGLYLEALKELDRVLEDAPDQADVRALLARSPLPLALPELPAGEAELEPFLADCARLSPTGRELVLQRLGGAPEITGLRAALGRELVQRASARRAFATLALRRMFPGSEAEGLLSRAVLDSSNDVRAGAALALKAFEDPIVIEPALRAVGSKNAEVRSNAIAALGSMGYREAVEPLYRHLVALQSGGGGYAPHVHIFNGSQRSYVQDFDVEVAQGQAIADPIINILQEGSVLDVAVIGVSEYQFQVSAERASVRRALSQLTGANPGETTVAWERWWKEHGDEWQAGEIPRKAPTSPGGQG